MIFLWERESVICMLVPKLEQTLQYSETGSSHWDFFCLPAHFHMGNPYGNGEGSFDAPLSRALITQILDAHRCSPNQATHMQTQRHKARGNNEKRVLTCRSPPFEDGLAISSGRVQIKKGGNAPRATDLP